MALRLDVVLACRGAGSLLSEVWVTFSCTQVECMLFPNEGAENACFEAGFSTVQHNAWCAYKSRMCGNAGIMNDICKETGRQGGKQMHDYTGEVRLHVAAHGDG